RAGARSRCDPDLARGGPRRLGGPADPLVRRDEGIDVEVAQLRARHTGQVGANGGLGADPDEDRLASGARGPDADPREVAGVDPARDPGELRSLARDRVRPADEVVAVGREVAGRVALRLVGPEDEAAAG